MIYRFTSFPEPRESKVGRGCSAKARARSVASSSSTRAVIGLLVMLFGGLGTQSIIAAEIEGELRRWHRVSLTFDGPITSEQAAINPFLDYRLQVTFVQGNRTVIVPGYYATDGDAAETSADAGNKWRVHFSPPTTGSWSYQASFRTGSDIAIDDDALAGAAVFFDGETGNFFVSPSNKGGRDLRGKGLLEYVNERYLRFAGNGEYFLKGGADSPENFLAFADFDQTTPTHFYGPHLSDWNTGDPTWGTDARGKAIIGALNYLSGAGMNSVYFLTMNVTGDGDDVWPWTDSTERLRFDCSKLDQWEVVFDHMDRIGIMLHVVTQETENDHLLDGGGLGIERKLYYRELIARFAHHNAITWNLGEENTNTDAQRIAFAEYFDQHDPYHHPLVVHTFVNQKETVYAPLLGNVSFEGPSLQRADNGTVIEWIDRSLDAGRPWVVCYDEQSPATDGVVPDSVDPDHDDTRKNVLWGTLIGGGGGVEYYFGYSYPNDDLDCEDWRSRANMWTQTDHALRFFRDYLPYWDMSHANSLTAPGGTRCLANPGVVYAVALSDGSRSIDLDLGLEDARYRVRWLDPRTGGALQWGERRLISGPGFERIGLAPNEDDGDWIALVERCGPNCLGDTNGDAVVDGRDLSSFLGCLLDASISESCVFADFTNDDVVDQDDLPHMIAALLAAGEPRSTITPDFNQDGQLNAADIPFLMACLFDETAEGDCGRTDLNADGLVNSSDLMIFVDRLLAE